MPSAQPPLLPVSQAQSRLFALAPRVAGETVALREAAGRWSAADVPALRTQPYADLSSMDGYAIRFADLPGPFALIGESAAGRPFGGAIGASETVRIFTGAALPPGADAILVQEDATREQYAGGDRIRLTGAGPNAPGHSVRRAGLDFRAGDPLIARGERLTPATIALAAAAGHGTLAVNRRVRVAVVATGEELVAPGAPLAPGALPESNGAMLAAMLADLPVDVTDLGILPDRLDATAAAFGAVDADILVTTGGASVGDHDLVRPAIVAAGGNVDFWRVALRPGKPMLAGRLNGMVVLGLPGNPVSAFVTAIVFLKPLIAAMAGARDPLPRGLVATLGEALPANDHRQDYLRAMRGDDHVVAAPVQDSSMLLTLARADCLIVRPPHAPPARRGDSVQILPIA